MSFLVFPFFFIYINIYDLLIPDRNLMQFLNNYLITLIFV